MVGAIGAGVVDADNAGVNQELRRQPYVSPRCQICPAALPDPEGRPR